jgi:hypothetical protein
VVVLLVLYTELRPTGPCTMNRVPKTTHIYLRMQGIQEQARQPMNFCSTLLISQDAIIHINPYPANVENIVSS